jgi:hypothetical protein
LKKIVLLALSIVTSLIVGSYFFSGEAIGETYLDTNSLVTVTIYNDLEYEGYGITIFYLYMAPTDSEYYSGDLLDSTGTIYMDYGEYVTLYVTPGDYDILAVDEDLDIWYQTYTVSSGMTRSSMDIYLDENEMNFEIDGTEPVSNYLEVTVNTESAVEYMFFSPTDSEYWGADHLGDQVLEKGDTIEISFGPGSQTTFDLLVVFNDGDQMVSTIDGTMDDSITLVDIPGDDDDTPVDDDDDTPIDDDDDTPVDDDDDTPVDDDDDTPVDDDDDLPPEQQPGGVPGAGGGVEGDNNKEDSSFLGFSIMVMVLIVIGAVFRFKRDRR